MTRGKLQAFFVLLFATSKTVDRIRDLELANDGGDNSGVGAAYENVGSDFQYPNTKS